MTTSYTFAIASLKNGKVDPTTLTIEIEGGGLATNLDHIESTDETLVIFFVDALSVEDETRFNAIVAAHTGESLPPVPIGVIQYASETKKAPVAADGKMFVLPNSFPGDVLINFTGCNDGGSPPKRFGGSLFGIQITGAGTETVTVDLLDGIFLAGGHIDWDGGAWGNEIYMELLAPASTTKAPAAEGQGNCNRVAIGGGYYMLVPADGNGTHDLDTVIPIPSAADETNEATGYWTYSEPWIGKGTISASIPGHGKYNLYTMPLELAHMCKLHLFLPTGQRDFVAPAIKPKWILPEWKLSVTATNTNPDATFRVCWDFLLARRKSV